MGARGASPLGLGLVKGSWGPPVTPGPKAQGARHPYTYLYSYTLTCELQGLRCSSLCRKIQFLAQPAAASAAERNWSIYGLIKSDRRTRLRPAVADKLVYCHEALALHAKLQDAAYRPEPEPWDEDSDEDSDASDEQDEEDEILRLTV